MWEYEPMRHEVLLTVLRRFRPILLPWHVFDPCFLHLDLLRYFHLYGSPREVTDFREVFREHYVKCSGCWKNVLATGQRAEDPFKQQVYRGLWAASLMASARWLGGAWDHERVEGGNHTRMVFPPSMAMPVAALECFTADDPNGDHWAILDAMSQEIFDDPGPIFEMLDGTVTEHVQECATRPEWTPIVWLQLALQWPVRMQLRWNGQVKTIAKDWSFQGRYRDLMLKNASEDLQTEGREVPGGLRTSASGESALMLRDLALKYDGRIPFGSFAKTTMGLRAIDQYRHTLVDARGHLSDDQPAGSDAEEGAGRTSLSELAEDPKAEPLWQQPGLPSRELFDLRERMKRLEPVLTERERAIVTLLMDEVLTDIQLAERLGVTRETINRDRRKIAEKARLLRLAS